MPLTVEDLKLRAEVSEFYVNKIRSNKQDGLQLLDEAVKDKNNKKVTAALRITIQALALARGYIKVDDIPVKLAEEVCEKWLKEAAWRERDVAADKGTEVHALAESISNGEIVDIPDELAGHVKAFQAFVDFYQVEFIETEFTVFDLTHGFGGTGDFLARFGRKPEWGIILGDYKTSESGIWPDIALQLAALRYAEFIARCKSCPHPDGNHPREDLWEDRSVLSTVNTTVGVQITADSFHVVPVRTTKHHFNTFLAGQNIAKWKTEGERFALDKDSEPKVTVK